MIAAAALTLAALSIGSLAGFWVALRHSQRHLEMALTQCQALRDEYRVILKQASDANVSIGERVVLLEDRINFLAHGVKK